MISLLVVLLHKDNRVLALGHLQVLQHTSLLACTLAGTQGVGLETTRHPTLWQGVDVDRDKQIGLGLISYLGTTVQLYKLIGFAGINHFYVGTVLLNHTSEGQRKLQREVLLLRDSTHGTRIVTAMTGIDHQRKTIFTSCLGHHSPYQQQHT